MKFGLQEDLTLLKLGQEFPDPGFDRFLFLLVPFFCSLCRGRSLLGPGGCPGEGDEVFLKVF
jgi:hypothetical protein